MPIKRVITKGRVPVKIYTDDVAENAIKQLENVSQLPFIHSHVAAMPDVHWGMGATIGSVIPTLGAIIPAAVGVDIGCGMNALRLSLRADQLPDSLVKVRAGIEAAVPVGFDGHANDAWCEAGLKRVAPGLKPILEKHPKINARWQSQLGSLGGGNHFIEVCLDEAQQVWIMLHSGSRGIGNRIGMHFIELAKREMEQWKIQLPDQNLAYLPEGSKHFDDYVEAVGWAQDYAMENRRQMMRLIIEALRDQLPPFEVTSEAINCHHNYVAREHHFGKDVYLTRKGAIRAREGDLGIIPGSMGAKSYIVRGLGNPMSFCSCSHGAGRRMSRGEATRRFTRKDLEAQTQGVECRKDKGVIDEIPAAYKDIDAVMANQGDLVEVVHTLKQVLTVKG
ncbi:RtcB family protein [Thiorhodococcus mannitoliphagus]|uniref:3'-phosphate/5'-hydroxy nucleic acid ligase n=1 Tax=Thiorhodococcus mannitoliphagus TaxID=329406 RepID=A0A6P1E1P2_9GAMM|nr:RtcB family protein [Thiorhodococcus mannitoliphagus]NEX22986.1 RtcB family protein [Thiorhodococcus mannitoliphagus]